MRAKPCQEVSSQICVLALISADTVFVSHSATKDVINQKNVYSPAFSLVGSIYYLNEISWNIHETWRNGYLAESRVGLSEEGKKDPGIIVGCKLKLSSTPAWFLPAQPAEKHRFSFALSQLCFKQALKAKLISVGLLPVYGMQNRALSWWALTIIEDTPGTAFGTARSTYLCDEVLNVGTQNKILEKLSYLEPRNLMIEVRFVWIKKKIINETMAYLKTETEK